ncbi:MAG: hypothetical protein ABL889_02800 [Terricaulis sp.]
MINRVLIGCAAAAAAFVVASCSAGTTLPVEQGYGSSPTLPEPREQTIPYVNIAPAQPWEGEAAPTPAEGLAVSAFVRDLDHPRWIYVLPNGDVLVAESNAPANRPDEQRGIRAFFMRQAMSQAGASAPSADRITLLRDADGDGIAEVRTTFISGLHSPFGMTLVGSDLYVANTDAIVRFRIALARPRSPRRLSASSNCRQARAITTGRRISSPAPTARGSTRP